MKDLDWIHAIHFTNGIGYRPTALLALMAKTNNSWSKNKNKFFAE